MEKKMDYGKHIIKIRNYIPKEIIKMKKKKASGNITIEMEI